MEPRISSFALWRDNRREALNPGQAGLDCRDGRSASSAVPASVVRIKRQSAIAATGFDFKATKYFAERFRYYQEAAKDGSVSFEPFATIVLKSAGRQSLADPLKDTGPFPPPEWIPLSLNVATFFATMPPKYYETFKNMLEEWSDSETKRIIARQRALLAVRS